MSEVDKAPLLSVVIASMNEEKGIRECLSRVNRAFQENKIDGEIIVADNSSDATPHIAAKMGARVVTPDRMGYGNALVYGINHARGDYVIIGDADNTYDFGVIPHLMHALESDQADMVIGSRYKGGIQRCAMPWLHRYIGNPLLTWGLNSALGTHVSDAHSGIRAFTREMWAKLDKKYIADDFCSELLKQMAYRSARIVEIPVIYYPRCGKTKAGTLLHGWRCFKFLLLRVVLERAHATGKDTEVTSEVLC